MSVEKESRRAGLLRLRHLMEVNEATGEDMAEQRERFGRLAGDDAKPRAVSAHNLFQTPEDLAARMAAMLRPDAKRILEPSAGLGRLYRAVRARSDAATIVLVDSSPDCCAELYRAIEGDDLARLVQRDFLECCAGPTDDPGDGLAVLGRFDAVIMNPPFKRRWF